jgi:hypothetical protein
MHMHSEQQCVVQFSFRLPFIGLLLVHLYLQNDISVLISLFLFPELSPGQYSNFTPGQMMSLTSKFSFVSTV